MIAQERIPVKMNERWGDILVMNFHYYSENWPAARLLFPARAESDTMPSDHEVRLKERELISRGEILAAQNLMFWWQMIPLAARESLGEPRYSAANHPLNQSPNSPEQEPVTGLKGVGLPVTIIALVIAFMLIVGVIFNPAAQSSLPKDLTTLELPSATLSQPIADPAVAPEQETARDLTVSEYTEFFSSVSFYSVSSNLTLSPAPTEDVAQVWKETVAIFGEDALKLKRFGVTYEDSEVSAYVDPIAGDLVIRLADENLEQSSRVYALTHEYNHVVQMNRSDSDYVSRTLCETHLVVEESQCVPKGAPLNLWIDNFWNGDPANTGTGDIEEGQARYERNPRDYVTVYAASAPQEDMAESFASWVFYRQIPEAKLYFLEHDPESVALKERILNSLHEAGITV